MSDGKVVISTELDSSGLEKDLKKLPKKIKNNTDNVKINTELNTEKAEKDLKKLKKDIENTKDIKIDATLDSTNLDSGLNKAKTEASSLNEEIKKVNSTINQTQTGGSYAKLKNSMSEAEKEAYKLEKQMSKLKDVLGGEIPESTQEAYKNIYKMNQEIRNTSREFGRNSSDTIKARNALNEYILGLDDATFKQVYMRSSLGLTDAQLTQQANSIKLNARMIKLMSNQTEILTQRMQGLQDKGIKPKDLLPASTLGQFKMLNETIKASQSPIYKLSAGYRALGTSMEQTIKGWTAQKMAVKLAGEDMVKYGLLLRGITAGQASLAMAFPIVGIAATLAYGAIFSSAIQANEGLQKLAETVKGKLGQAFKPLLDTAGQFLEIVLNMTLKIADLMIKFNELHPTIAKIISAIALLTPAMTLLLLPLNMGIGLLAGWKVAINGAWVAIGGIASAVGIAASTFLAFATVIGAVVGGLIYLWNTNEGFKSAVLTAWSAISEKGKEVFGGLANTFSTLSQTFSEGGLSGLLTAGSQIITNLVQGLSTSLPLIIAKMNEVRMTILNSIASNLPQILTTGVQIITLLIQGIAQALPLLMNIGIQIITSIINTIVTNLPTIISTGITILTTLLDGIIQALPVLIGAGVQVLGALVDAITENLPLIIDAGLSILNTLVEAIIELLPLIITAGVNILVALIGGITEALPQLIAMLPTIITTIITVISENLPLIIEAGIKILIALIEGLIQALPQLIAMTPQIIDSIISVLIQNLPLLISAGVQLLVAIINGLIQAIPQLIAAVPQIASSLIGAFGDVDWGSIGENIINGIGQGLENAKDALLNKASSIASNITSTIKNALDIHSPSRIMRDEVGSNIVKGISVGMELESPNLQSVADEQIGILTAKLQSTVDYETARTTASITASANKEAGVNTSTQTITNDNGLSLNIENFNNNTDSDIEDISSELAFLYKKKIL